MPHLYWSSSSPINPLYLLGTRPDDGSHCRFLAGQLMPSVAYCRFWSCFQRCLMYPRETLYPPPFPIWFMYFHPLCAIHVQTWSCLAHVSRKSRNKLIFVIITIICFRIASCTFSAVRSAHRTSSKSTAVFRTVIEQKERSACLVRVSYHPFNLFSTYSVPTLDLSVPCVPAFSAVLDNRLSNYKILRSMTPVFCRQISPKH